MPEQATMLGPRSWLQIGRAVVALALLAALLSAWERPSAASGSLERISGGSLRVGIVVNPPWTHLRQGEPGGVEVELLRALADELGARLEWAVGPEEELLNALRHGQLDVAAGGFTRTNPWARELGATYSYHHSRIVVAAAPYAPPIARLTETPVMVRAGSSAAAHLSRAGGQPIPVRQVSRVTDYAAVADWELERHQLKDTGVILHTQQHVMLVPKNEGAWLARLEGFLRRNEATVGQLLSAASAGAGPR